MQERREISMEWLSSAGWIEIVRQASSPYGIAALGLLVGEFVSYSLLGPKDAASTRLIGIGLPLLFSGFIVILALLATVAS